MNTKNKIIISVVLISTMISAVSAQTTGSFSTTITFSTPYFPNQVRAMQYYVPASYTATKKYKLFISLGGQGWTLQEVLKDPGYNDGTVDLLNASAPCSPAYGDFIAVAPDISPKAYQDGASSGTWPYPAGADDGLPEAIINKVKATYNIDTNYVYLTGFSLGGRGALMLGLQSYKKLRGLILFTPAVQGKKEAQDLDSYQHTTPAYAFYDYANAIHIPICMTVGGSDPYGGGCSSCSPVDPVASYATVIVPEINNQLIAAGAGSTTKFTTVSGISHQPPPASYMCGCFTFIEGHVATGISSEEDNKHEMLIYPNPTDGKINFNANQFIPIVMGIVTEEVEIYNVMGEVVHRQTLTSSNLQMDVSFFPAGLYSIRMKNHPEITSKFIKQ
jgi:hypothetical protein